MSSSISPDTGAVSRNPPGLPNLPGLSDIRGAHKRIRDHIHRTPVITSRLLDSLWGAQYFFKSENLQKVGAFKFRGACNAVFSLSEDEALRGVATHSSGNHAAALALAAQIRGCKAHIVMPEDSVAVKVDAVRHYGAEITFCMPTLEARETTLAEVVERTGATFIHPYDRFEIIAGQATAALELLEDYSELDFIIAPVGGGGLLAGTAIAAKAMNPNIRVIAAEPEGADDAYRSFGAHEHIPQTNPQTIADGLRTSVGVLNYAAMMKYVDAVEVVSEEAIVEAMRNYWQRTKSLIEPSSAVPMALVASAKMREKLGIETSHRVGIIVSGGNVDLGQLPF